MAIDYSKRKPAAAAAPPPGAAPAGGPVSLSKVTLTKNAPSVSLTKQGSAGGLLRVNLNWTAKPAAPAGGGFLKRMAASATPATDLDLGCLYEFTDGTKGVVQALGNAFTANGSFSNKPVIWLDGDDRSGVVTGGENLHVDLAQSKNIRRILVFAQIYEGASNWAAAAGVVTLFPTDGPQVEIQLDEHDPKSRLCAVAMFESQNGELVVRREVRYIQGSQRNLDEQYGWGMQWSAGRK
jgi:tellurite resistance protein TerA